METVNQATKQNWSEDVFAIIRDGQLEQISRWYQQGGAELLQTLPAVPAYTAVFAPLYRHPRKIWGIGMNYVQNPAELGGTAADSEPVGFMKPDTTLIGPHDPIVLPAHAGTITGEAELAIIIGKACKDITEAEAPGVVAGFTTSLDMTAADIHAKNPRFLTRAKSFDTFFSFGPYLVTTDEIANVLELEVETGLNGEMLHRNVVFNMRYRPWYAVSFHSRVMTLLPGDIILTGTPGPVVIRGGDVSNAALQDFLH